MTRIRLGMTQKEFREAGLETNSAFKKRLLDDPFGSSENDIDQITLRFADRNSDGSIRHGNELPFMRELLSRREQAVQSGSGAGSFDGYEDLVREIASTLDISDADREKVANIDSLVKTDEFWQGHGFSGELSQAIATAEKVIRSGVDARTVSQSVSDNGLDVLRERGGQARSGQKSGFASRANDISIVAGELSGDPLQQRFTDINSVVNPSEGKNKIGRNLVFAAAALAGAAFVGGATGAFGASSSTTTGAAGATGATQAAASSSLVSAQAGAAGTAGAVSATGAAGTAGAAAGAGTFASIIKGGQVLSAGLGLVSGISQALTSGSEADRISEAATNEAAIQEQIIRDEAVRGIGILENDTANLLRQRGREIDRFKAVQKVSFIKSGVDLSGTPLSVLAETEQLGDEELTAIQTSSDLRIKAIKESADARARAAGLKGQSIAQQAQATGRGNTISGIGTAVNSGVGLFQAFSK